MVSKANENDYFGQFLDRVGVRPLGDVLKERLYISEFVGELGGC
jgi:hypothetical protein